MKCSSLLLVSLSCDYIGTMVGERDPRHLICSQAFTGRREHLLRRVHRSRMWTDMKYTSKGDDDAKVVLGTKRDDEIRKSYSGRLHILQDRRSASTAEPHASLARSILA